MNTEQSGMELRWILAVVRRWWWLICGCTLLAGAIALFVTARMTPSYEATATLLIQPAQDTRSTEYNVLIAGERLALTYSEMLKGRPVLDTVISENQLQETSAQLSQRVAAQPVRDTQLIRLTVKDTSPERAVFLANAVSRAFIEHLQTLQMERYASSLNDMQDKMAVLSSQIEEIQSKIQDLTIKKIDNEAEQARLESLLAGYRSSYQQLQQDDLALQVTVATSADGVSIAEAARASSIAPATTAIVTLLVDQNSDGGTGNYSPETYGEMLVGRSVLEAAITQVDQKLDVDWIASRVQVAPVPGTQLIQLSVVLEDISLAVRLADAIAGSFVDQMEALHKQPYIDRMNSLQAQMEELQQWIEEAQGDLALLASDSSEVETGIATLQSKLTEYRTDYRALEQSYSQMQLTVANAADAVVIAEPAQLPGGPVGSGILKNALIAAIAGAMVGFGIAFLLEYLDDTLRTPDDVRRLLGLNTLGTIGRLPKGEDELVVISQPRSPLAEAFRVLATNLRFANLDQPLRTLLVTSPHPLEGKSIVAANLAVAMAQKELRVVVVDADLRLPRLHEVFGVEPGKGLSAVLQQGNLDGNLQPSMVERLKLLVAGEMPPNPAEVLDSPRMRQVLADLAQEADLLVIDSPPVLPAADAATLAATADGVLLVLRAGHTRREAARHTLESLRQVNANLIGVVLNGVHVSGVGYDYSHYRGYESGGNGTPRRARRGWTPAVATLPGRILSVGTLQERIPSVETLREWFLTAKTRWGPTQATLRRWLRKTHE